MLPRGQAEGSKLDSSPCFYIHEAVWEHYIEPTPRLSRSYIVVSSRQRCSGKFALVETALLSVHSPWARYDIVAQQGSMFPPRFHPGPRMITWSDENLKHSPLF
jgi:hypothetical protein